MDDDFPSLPTSNRAPVKRLSISLPEPVYHNLSKLVADRGFETRSQAIASIIDESFAQFQEEVGDRVMVGTITLFYENRQGRVQGELARVQQKNIAEIISSQHVLLQNNHMMEIILVQGPGDRLRDICNEFITCKGVRGGKLSLSSEIMPPLHSHNKRDAIARDSNS
ncbi:MAG: nickel-responsive transcriptional regulator NikR [Verrucomicrobiota bacterium]